MVTTEAQTLLAPDRLAPSLRITQRVYDFVMAERPSGRIKCASCRIFRQRGSLAAAAALQQTPSTLRAADNGTAFCALRRVLRDCPDRPNSVVGYLGCAGPPRNTFAATFPAAIKADVVWVPSFCCGQQSIIKPLLTLWPPLPASPPASLSFLSLLSSSDRP